MAGQAQKIANSDNLPQKPYKVTMYEKNYFNFLKMYSFQDNKEKEKSSFYLFECAKITVKQHEIKKTRYYLLVFTK